MTDRLLPPAPWATDDAGRFTAAEHAASDAVLYPLDALNGVHVSPGRCPVCDAFAASTTATLDRLELRRAGEVLDAIGDADAAEALDALLVDGSAWHREAEELRVERDGALSALALAEANVVAHQRQIAALTQRCADLDVVAASHTVADAVGTYAVVSYHPQAPEDRRWYVGAEYAGHGPTLRDAVAACLAAHEEGAS